MVVAPLHASEEEQICPLCINELDQTEKAWLPCSCGYQLCLFCYDRLKTEFSNRCPNCRVEYDSDFQAGLRRRQERVAQLQRDASEACDASKAAAAAAERAEGSGWGAPPPPPPPRVVARAVVHRSPPRSPRRDLHIEQEQLWPSLGAATQAATAQQQQQPQTVRQPPAPGERRLLPLPRLAPIVAPTPAEQEASSSGSADTAATTPQSPVSSVVSFRAAQPPTAAASSVAGRCAVVLQCGGSAFGADPDPDGASLAASLQEAVRSGSLSVKQAAATLASYLRQRQQAAATAAVGSASSSPGRSSRQPSSAGSVGAPGGPLIGYSPFCLPGAAGLLATSEASLTPCASGHSVPTSVTLSHWASSTASPASSTLSLHSAQMAGGEVERLPLYMRRGTLPPVSAGAASGGAGEQQLEGKRVIRPPPGFAAPIASGIRA